MENVEEMYFFISDISGYTAFMLKHDMDYEHGMLVIMQLMETLVKEIKFPFEISKLEGDALFIFIRKANLPKEYVSEPLLLGQKILSFFEVFYKKQQELIDTMGCFCGGCSNANELDLKIVGHYGKAALTRIGSFLELSGSDVIIPHRLLKNEIPKKCYLLLTDSACKQKILPQPQEVIKLQSDLGTFPVYVYYPKKKEMKHEERKTSLFEKRKAHLKMVLTDTLLKIGLKRKYLFRNLPAPIEK